MARAPDPALARLAATHIVGLLRDASFTAYFAGGCVRDELLGLRPTDYDVATDAPPGRISALFPKTSQVGAAFGVVLVHITPDQLPGLPARTRASVEVATFRADGPYSDARRPDRVDFSDERADAARRDFTINALFLDPLTPPDDAQRAEVLAAGFPAPLGRIIDHVGGLRDIESRLLRAVGDPDQRLSEDHLRALRAVRFAARLGFRIDPGTAAAVRRHAAHLRGVSRERIGEELRRMFAHPSRTLAAEILQSLELDAPTLDTPHAAPQLPRFTALSARFPPRAFALCLAAWELDRTLTDTNQGAASLSAEQARAAITRLRGALCLSNEETQDLRHAFRVYHLLAETWDTLSIADRRRAGANSVFTGTCAMLEGVDPDRAGRVAAERERLAADAIGLSPAPLLTGDDLVAAGLQPGPLFRRILEEVTDAQLEGRISTPAQAMELARSLRV